ncbi:hypothetical protein [Pedobacter sp. SYP-B3415]|uniref:hypothetical protein n=1 Tax=Pedobacter sp. SYP-B3415 TaxID=2496641 RepID=UPI00101C8BD4|nr:hypothetical protein [Pedobacter sp. SYP-B3415]
MKNFKKSLGGILGIAAAIALIFTQSAFTGTATRYYFYDDGTGAQWHDEAPVGKSCATDPQRICSAEFESTPESNSNLISANPEAEDMEVGKLQ